MILNAAQINETINKLNANLKEQERILTDAERVVMTELSACWECEAQRAYAESFISIKNRVLVQINSLIELFGKALVQSQNGLYEVDINISKMNSSAIK